MKKIIFSVLCLGMAISASAQLSQSSESSSSQQETRGANAIAPMPFNKVMFTYSPLTMKSYLSFSGVNAIGATYMHGSLLAKFPLYLEFGGGVQYTFYKKNDIKINAISVNIPVNILYRFAFNGGKLHLAPYTGFYGRINAWGNLDEDKQKLIVMSADELFGSEGLCSRFQFGWQIGAQFDVNKFYLHVGYLTDITNCFKDSDDQGHLGGANFGIGVVF